ncbi:MAG: hypothetical protein KDD45_11175 [Bdellovibrionales bacterium]|nr:hypothetical protein [Bdellovibrionales bacterium]
MQKIYLIFISAVMLILSGCFNGKNDRYIVDNISAASHLAADIPNNEKADLLAKDAEELFSADGYSEAVKVSEEALKINPFNTKAQFIYYLSRYMLVNKGIFVRLKPLFEKYPLATSKLKQQLDQIKIDSTTGLVKFFEMGSPDINTIGEFQNYLDESIIEALNFQSFLISNEDKTLVLKPSSLFLTDLTERFVEACEIKETENLEFELKCPEDRVRSEAMLNSADFEMLYDAMTMSIVVVESYNSYTLDGLLEESNKAEFENTPAADVFNNLIKNHSRFGLLRKNNRLGNIRPSVKRLIASLNWIIDNQNTICPVGYDNPNNRPGMFFYKGSCLPKSFKSYLNQYESYLRDDAQNFVIGKNISYKTKINYTAFLTKPILDLKKLGPVKVNACDYMTYVQDVTLAGIFPYGDANKVLEANAAECNQ